MEKKRIGYIDALRGFTMILVVYSHVLAYSFQSTPAFSFNDIFITFRMPLFFFLSGFLMYKINRFRDRTVVLDFLKKKVVVQLIPTLIFTVVFCLVFRYSFQALWFEKSKCGYWFTVTLFYFFCIYSVGDLLLSKLLHGKWKVLAGASVALLIYAFSKYSLSAGCPWANSFLCGFIGYANLQYFLFFFFGAFIKAYFNSFQELLDRKGSACCFIAGFVIVQFLLHLPQSKDFIINTISFSAWSLLKTFAGFFGIVTVFAFFRRFRSVFENSRIGDQLQYIGSRTLDIYLIHLLLIRTNLSFFGEFLSKYPNPLMELVLVTTASLLIIAICLIISNVLRCSDILAKLLFGKIIKP